MLKWILGAAALVLLGVFVLWQRGSVKTSFVNGLAPYDRLAGTEYIFERDCYIFKLKDADTDWPLVGDHDVVPGLPAEVAERYVGAELPGVRILDIVRTGSRFRIASVRRDQSRGGTTISFEIFFLDDTDRKYPRLDAYKIMDHSPESRGQAPTLLRDYTVASVRE